MILGLSEWIAIAYLMHLIGAAGFGRLAATATSRTVVRALLTIFAVLWVSRYESGIGLIVRNLAPAVYLLMMYWLPAELVVRPNVRFERS